MHIYVKFILSLLSKQRSVHSIYSSLLQVIYGKTEKTLFCDPVIVAKLNLELFLIIFKLSYQSATVKSRSGGL